MPSKLKPIRAQKIVVPTLSSFTYTEIWKSEFVRRLGINDNNVRAEAIDRFNAVLSDALQRTGNANSGPLRAHHIVALSEVREAAERLHKIIAKLDEPYRSNLPDADVFVGQLEIFHDQLAIVLMQMKALKNARGGARKVEQAKAREVSLHALRTFFDRNAVDVSGTLRTSSLQGQDRATWETYMRDRDDFVEWASSTAGMGSGKAKRKVTVASKTVSGKKKRAARS